MFDGGHNFMWCGFSLKIYILFFFWFRITFKNMNELMPWTLLVLVFFLHIFMSFVAVLFSGHSARADTKLLTHFYTYLILCAMKRMKSKICIASCWIFATAHQIIEFSFRLCDLNSVVLWHLFRLHGPNTGQSGATNALCYASFLIHGSLCVSYRSVEVCWFISKYCGVVCVWPSICAWARIMLQYLACTQIESHSSSNTYVYMRIRSMYTQHSSLSYLSLSYWLALFLRLTNGVCVCDNMVFACDVHATDSLLKQRWFSLQWYVVQQHTSTNRAEQSRAEQNRLSNIESLLAQPHTEQPCKAEDWDVLHI